MNGRKFILASTLCFFLVMDHSSLSQGIAGRVEQLTRDVSDLQKRPAPTQTANAKSPLQVQNSLGKVAATVSTVNDTGVITIKDAQGSRNLVELSADSDGGRIWLTGTTGSANSKLLLAVADGRGLVAVGDGVNNLAIVRANVAGGEFRVYRTDTQEVLYVGVSSANSGLVAITKSGGTDLVAKLTTRNDGLSGIVELSGPDAAVLVNGQARDYAEVFELSDRTGIRPGSVVSAAADGTGLVLSSGAYNPAVVGVVSGAGNLHSGMVIGSRDDESIDLPVALSGQVFVRVSIEGGTIAVGDLLVGSSTPGSAMRAGDPGRLTGTVIGKALQPYSSQEEGLIRMLVLNR